MTWDETLPENDDQVRGFGAVVRSHKTEFRAAMRKHFYWSNAESNTTEGDARLNSASSGTGACRAFFAAQSAASAFRDGALFVASDTSRLIALTSVSSAVVGGTRAIQWQSGSGVSTVLSTSDTRVLVQRGVEASLGDGSHDISFTTVYNGVPSVTIGFGHAPSANVATNDAVMGISDITTGGFSIVLETPVSLSECYWRSIGTVSLL